MDDLFSMTKRIWWEYTALEDFVIFTFICLIYYISSELVINVQLQSLLWNKKCKSRFAVIFVDFVAVFFIVSPIGRITNRFMQSDDDYIYIF